MEFFACLSVAVLSWCGLVVWAWRSRRAHRTLWAEFESFRRQVAAEKGLAARQWQRCYGRLEAVRLGLSNPVQLTAQHAEDVFLVDYFSGERSGFFIEVGAYDGIRYSNTYALEQVGWRGLLIEANPANVQKCRTNRPRSMVEHAAVGGRGAPETVVFHQVLGQGEDMLSFVSADDAHLSRCRQAGARIEQTRVPCRTMDQLIEKYGISRIDLLSIDIEGGEIDALNGLDFSTVRPRLIILEANQPAARKALEAVMNNLGYQPLGAPGCNVVFEDAANPMPGFSEERVLHRVR